VATLLIAARASCEPCSCERVAALEAQTATLEAQVASLSTQMQQVVATLKETSSGVPEQVLHPAVNVAPNGSTSSTAGRRLTTSTPLMALQSSRHVVHQLGASCANAQGYLELLPTKSDGTVAWDPSPIDATTDLALVQVQSDWSTLDVHRFPAPFKMVHDASCSTTPTLELQLNTNVAGSLSVNGVGVGGQGNVQKTAHVSDGSFTFFGSNTFTSLGLTKSVVLTAQRTVLAHYKVTGMTGATTDGSYIACHIKVDGAIDTNTVCINGNIGQSGGTYFNTDGLYMDTLTAGTHTIEAECRGPAGVTFTGNYMSRSLQVLVL